MCQVQWVFTIMGTLFRSHQLTIKRMLIQEKVSEADSLFILKTLSYLEALEMVLIFNLSDSLELDAPVKRTGIAGVRGTAIAICTAVKEGGPNVIMISQIFGSSRLAFIGYVCPWQLLVL